MVEPPRQIPSGTDERTPQPRPTPCDNNPVESFLVTVTLPVVVAVYAAAVAMMKATRSVAA